MVIPILFCLAEVVPIRFILRNTAEFDCDWFFTWYKL